MFQYSPILERSSIWDLKFTFSIKCFLFVCFVCLFVCLFFQFHSGLDNCSYFLLYNIQILEPPCKFQQQTLCTMCKISPFWVISVTQHPPILDMFVWCQSCIKQLFLLVFIYSFFRMCNSISSYFLLVCKCFTVSLFISLLIFKEKNIYVKGVLHLLPQKAPKLACFVFYLKIINIFLKNNICIL